MFVESELLSISKTKEWLRKCPMPCHPFSEAPA